MCPACPNVLGEQHLDGSVLIRHDGRTIITDGLPRMIVCEDCKRAGRAGGVWLRPEARVALVPCGPKAVA